MILYSPTFEEEDWPTRMGRMENHPITLVCKNGVIVWAHLYERNNDLGPVGPTDHFYSTDEYWTQPGRSDDLVLPRVEPEPCFEDLIQDEISREYAREGRSVS